MEKGAELLDKGYPMKREGSDDAFDDFFDQAATALHLVGPDGRILRANRAELDLLGYSEQEYIGRHIADFHADPEAIADILKRLAARETLRDHEARLRCKDGAIKHVLINSNVKWDQGRFVHTRCFTTDITARKHMEAELREREGDFRQLLDQLPIGVYVCDREAVLTRYNRRATEIWGRAPVIGDRAERYCGSFRLWTPDGRPLPHEETPIAGVLAGGAPARNVDLIVERPDGTRVAVQADIEAIRNRDGEVVGAINCFQDVSDRQQAKAALRDAEALLRTVVTNAPIVVFALDREGVFTLSEGKGLLAMGLHPGDAVGRSVFDLYRDAPWVLSSVRRALHGETSTRNGAVGPVWFEMHHAPLRDDQGQVIGVVGVAVDLTDQKRIEEEVSRASKLESIGVLAGGIAHDFNNMLMAIVGNLSLAKLLVDREGKVFQRIDESQKAAMRARTLTQQLLTFSRGGKPVRKLMALEPVIRESAGFALQGSNVRCELEFADPLWPVEADEGQVGQVIANLVINAQQAMPEGGTVDVHVTNVTLTAHEAPPLPAGDYVKINVTDSGSGIEPALVPRIFDPFFTTKPKGSGLGLTTCYWIAKRHEGHLDVESRLGAGTTFHCYLPRSEQPVPPAEEPPHQAPACGRVLLMDDDESVREAVEGMLVGLGYEVEGSRDGAEAVERFMHARDNGRAFDAVILDLTVRDGMGGKEALAKLLVIDPGVKAIVSSGYSNDPLMSDFQQAGFFACLSKPFEIEHLDEILSRAIAQLGAQ